MDRLSAFYKLDCGGLVAVLIGLFLSVTQSARAAEVIPGEVVLFLQKHCIRCHQGEQANGKIDLALLASAHDETARNFKTWKLAVQLVTAGEMPPADEPQPNDKEREHLRSWYRRQFETVAARPGRFTVRRLSVIEYRNTLESLFGFPLKVAGADSQQTKFETSLVIKLMPVDPKGPSGFTNDTSHNPLTAVTWERYAYLADAAISQLFSSAGQKELQAYTGPLDSTGLQQQQAAQLLKRFQYRAWRRLPDEESLASHRHSLAGKQGPHLIEAVQRELKTILMSPEFIYRGLLAARQPGEVAAVDSFELAERLSYFLWSDMPDEELFSAAQSGEILRPEKFRQQVARMLKSPQSRALAEVFAVEWLLLDEIDNATREVAYAAALKGQPVEFIHDLISRDRPLREIIQSRSEFVNLYLANFYAADAEQLSRNTQRSGVEQETLPLERIQLEQTPGRGGLLTMPGVLIMNKGAIQRGTWLLERILGDPLGEPPPDVPPVQPQKPGQKLSFRERFAVHRANQACAVCHDRIDPLGFVFESYNERGGFLLAVDAGQQMVGKYRPLKNLNKSKAATTDNVLDTSGILPTGERFQDVEELKGILTGSQWPKVVENLVRQTLSYALCRELTATDEPVVAELTTQLAQPGVTWGDLIQAVAGSMPFQQAYYEAPRADVAPAR